MSFLGGITVRLKVRNGQIEEATVQPDKEIKAEKVLIGRNPVEAIGLIENLFALCPQSQRAAAEAAMSTALEGQMSTELKDSLSRTILGERISEGFRFFVLQLPDDQWKKANVAEIASLWKMVRKLNGKELDPTSWLALQEVLNERLGNFLNKDFDGLWENELLNGTFSKATGIASIFSKLSSHRTIGWNPVAPLKISNEVFLENLKSTGTLLENLSTGPFHHFTGAYARMRKSSLTDTLLKTDGPSAYTRFAARFEELFHDLRTAPEPSQLIGSLQLGDLSAVSIVQNSRGVLLHYAKLEKNTEGEVKISDYCILTPTEINVTKAPSFTKSLQGISGATEQEVGELANLVTLSYDPCTEVKMEIDHA